jgi:Asp-tRNA(Asn)/Glu-tRNA(Gln) amidotransferase A subunit family amidase
MTPLAIGSQTNGSMIRPASFCGVVGYKPSRGSIPLTGVLALSGALDQIGIYGHTIEDVALVETVMGPEPGKLGVNPGPLMATAMSAPLVRPKLGFVRTPYWDHAEPETRSAFEKLVVALGADIEEAPLPEEFASTAGWLRTIMSAEMAHNMGHILDTHPGEMSKVLSDYLNEGRQVAATEYLAARTRQNQLREALAPTFGRFDALLTPAAVGEAIPFDQGSTGDPIFCTIWTFCGLPSVSLPLLKGPNGLPVGVQLVGAPNNDAQLLRTARWLTERLGVPLG